MTSAKGVGRTVGILFLVQGIGAVVMNFVLLQPALNPPGFLVNAAPRALQVGISVLLGFLTGAIALAIAIAVLPIFKRHSERMALAFVALATAALSLAVVENGTVMSLVS